MKKITKFIQNEIKRILENELSKDFPDHGVHAKIKLTNKNIDLIFKQLGIEDDDLNYISDGSSTNNRDMSNFVKHIEENYKVSDIISFMNEDESWLFFPDGWTGITTTPYPKMFAEALVQTKFFNASDIINLYYAAGSADRPTNPEPGVVELFVKKFSTNPKHYLYNLISDIRYSIERYNKLDESDVFLMKYLLKNKKVSDIVKKLYPQEINSVLASK